MLKISFSETPTEERWLLWAPRAGRGLSWERLGKEVEIVKRELSRTESTGRVFLYVLTTRRWPLQIWFCSQFC
jgi:hypothetical protein